MSKSTPLRTLHVHSRFPVGTWLSLVEHSLGVRGVGSSNLPVPTNFFVSFIPAPAKHPSLNSVGEYAFVYVEYNVEWIPQWRLSK